LETTKLLGKELAGDDSPLPLVVAELRRLDDRSATLRQASQARQERLSAIEQVVERIRIIREVVALQEKNKLIEAIQGLSAYQQLEERRDRFAERGEDLEEIKEAVSQVAADEAKEKLAAAGQTIDDYFRQLTRHPAVERITLSHRTGAGPNFNSYEIS